MGILHKIADFIEGREEPESKTINLRGGITAWEQYSKDCPEMNAVSQETNTGGITTIWGTGIGYCSGIRTHKVVYYGTSIDRGQQ